MLGGVDRSFEVQASVKREAHPTPKTKPSSPKRNMFGQIIEEAKPLGCSVVHETLKLKQDSIENPTISHAKENQAPTDEFALLCKGDRSNSLPRSHSTSFKVLTRKPSLKKISSIGRLSNHESADGLKQSVSFGNLKIREYNVALSNHPSCSYGPPVQLSWDYREKEVVPLDSYEESREPRREAGDLVLSYYDRRFMLLKQAGCSKTEVKASMKEVERVKRGRMITDLFLPASPLDETMEHVIDTAKYYFKKQEDV